jgi:hypothetical protein
VEATIGEYTALISSLKVRVEELKAQLTQR